MRKYLHEIRVIVLCIFLTWGFVFLVSNIKQTKAKAAASPVILMEILDSEVLEHEQFLVLETTSSFSSSYGISYSFSTNPGCTVQVTLIPSDEVDAWQNNLPCEEHVLCTASSHYSTVRFPHTDVWAITFWNIGYKTTTISFTASIVEMGAPSSGGGSSDDFPWGLAIGLPIVGIALISGIVIFAVRHSRKQKAAPAYPMMGQQSYGGFQTIYSNNASITFLMNQAVIEMDRGNFRGALNLWRQVLSLNPNISSALTGAGLCYFYLKEYNEACAYLSKAVMFEPTNLQLHEFLRRAKLLATANKALSSPSTDITSGPSHSENELSNLEDEKEAKEKEQTNESSTISTETPICPYCGMSLSETIKFCPYCGNRLE